MEGVLVQLRDIQYVVTLAEELNFSKAAKTLFISQPALSQAIKRLEDELGVTLFSRRNNTVELTRAGELFREDGHKILQLSNHLKRQMEDIQKQKQGKLCIGITSLFGRFYFPKIYQVFRKLYPGIEILVSEDTSEGLEALILRGKIEFAILPLPLLSNQLVYEPIVEEETLLAVPPGHPINQHMHTPPMGEFNCVDIGQFQDDDFIMLYPGQRIRTLCIQACRAAGFEPHIVFETRNTDTVCGLVSAGMGVGFIPETISRAQSEQCRAVFYRIREMKANRKMVAAYYHAESLSHSALEFIRIAHDIFG